MTSILRPIVRPAVTQPTAEEPEWEVEWIDLEPVDSYQLELENVSDAIRGEAELLLGREDAVAQARALEALHNSAMSAHSGS